MKLQVMSPKKIGSSPHPRVPVPWSPGQPDRVAALFSTSMRLSPGDGPGIVPWGHEHGVERGDLGGFRGARPGGAVFGGNTWGYPVGTVKHSY